MVIDSLEVFVSFLALHLVTRMNSHYAKHTLHKACILYMHNFLYVTPNF